MSAPEAGPLVVCVIGTKNSGKTTLTVELVRELAGRGHRVMSAKHGHGFRLDTPGTDSWKHRNEGGAERVALVGPTEMAVVGRWGDAGELPLKEVVRRFLSGAEIVIAEGFKTAPYPKIEVFRSGTADAPLMLGGDPGRAPAGHGASNAAVGPFLALVADGPSIQVDVAVLDPAAPDTVAKLADLVEGLRTS